MKKKAYSRRTFIKKNFLTGCGTILTLGVNSSLFGEGRNFYDNTLQKEREPIIDIHSHTDYHDRTNDELLAHQRAMGITHSILLPAWRPEKPTATFEDASRGVGWETTGNEACYEFAQKYPGEFFFGANQVPGLPDTIKDIEYYLKLGAPIIGEMKFGVDCDSPGMQKIYELAQSYNVPVLLHFQYGSYNHGFERFYTMLEKYPKVNFIGHAQTWWVNIDKKHQDQNDLYPQTKVTPGGLTDRLLSEYPNMYGELSAGSGLNSLTRDEEHAEGFLDRHQDKLIYGSDCGDPIGREPECRGKVSIITIRRLSPNKIIERKVLYENAKKLLKL